MEHISIIIRKFASEPKTIEAMAQLVELLEKVNDSSVKDNAFEIFKEIATELMSKFAIKKGDDYYQMVEIEFYWYSPNHPDLSVYPRRSKAGNWFLHPSGVDITLESCVEEDISMLQLRKDWENAKKNQENQNVVYSKSSYGGILIRSMRKFKPTNDPTNSASFILGPWNCCDALFDYIPCDGNFKDINTMLPEITYYDKVEMMPDLDKKMENIEGNLICEAKRNGISEKHSVQYKDAHYCFYINPDYLTGWKSSSYSNKPWYKKRQ